MIPAPSPITNPDLWLSNGRDDSSGRSLNLVVSARILVKEIKKLLVILKLTGDRGGGLTNYNHLFPRDLISYRDLTV